MASKASIPKGNIKAADGSSARRYSDAEWRALEDIAVRRAGAAADAFHQSRPLMDALLEFAVGWQSFQQTLMADIYGEPNLWAELRKHSRAMLSVSSRFAPRDYEVVSGEDPSEGTFSDPKRMSCFLEELEAFARHASQMEESGPPVRRGARGKQARNQVWQNFADVWTQHYGLHLGQGRNSPAADFLIQACRPVEWLQRNEVMEMTPDAARGFIRARARS